MADIYARNVQRLYPNDGGGYVCLCNLYTTTEPDDLPESGDGIVGMIANDTFGAGCEMIATTAKKRWILGEDEGTFELRESWAEPETDNSADA